ncbi:MAG: hypothetical protein HZC42_15525 [Candidatus Eisenbacteria bacterium]|nr:hypothetical protein [Candidatus Eisenbacteria bacterium]
MHPGATGRDTWSEERGTTLAEVLLALVVFSIGILAVAQLFPAGSRGQVGDQLASSANYYARDKVEQLSGVAWSDSQLTVGSHPAGGATEGLGSNGQWQRSYEVAVLPAPLTNLKKLTVTVTWQHLGPHSVTATTYIKR